MSNKFLLIVTLLAIWSTACDKKEEPVVSPCAPSAPAVTPAVQAANKGSIARDKDRVILLNEETGETVVASASTTPDPCVTPTPSATSEPTASTTDSDPTPTPTPSTEVTVDTSSTVVPVLPSAVVIPPAVVTAGTVSAPSDEGSVSGSTSLVFQWAPATDASDAVAVTYNIKIGNTAGGEEIFSGNVGHVTTYTATVTGPGVYYASVQAVLGTDISAWSTASNGIFVDLTPPAFSTTPVTAATAGTANTPYVTSTTFYVSWTAPTDTGSGITQLSALVYASSNCSGTATPVSGIATTATSSPLTGTTGQIYSIKISATDAAGNVGLSPCSSAITIDSQGPSAPSALTVGDANATGPNDTYDKDGTIYFGWAASTDATSGLRDYTLMHYSQANCGGSAVSVPTLSATTYSLSGIATGTTKSFKVSSYDNAGNSTTSVCSSSIVVDLTPPPALTALTGHFGTAIASITVKVDFPSDTSDYDHVVIRSLAGATPPATCAAGTTVATYTTFTDDSFQDAVGSSGVSYSYRACIYDHAGNLTETNTITAAQSARTIHRIFVSSIDPGTDMTTTYAAHTFASGVEGADYRCQDLATTQGLGGSWQALISEDGGDAKLRIRLNGPVFNMRPNPDGPQLVAHDEAELWSGTILAPISYTQTGASSGAPVVTGTKTDGTFDSGSGATYSTCRDWTDTSNCQGYSGDSTATDSTWLRYASASGSSNYYRIYCIENDVPKLTDFTAVTGSSMGEVDLQINLPGTTTLIGRIEVQRNNSGRRVPSTCTSTPDSLVATLTSPYSGSWTFTDPTGALGLYSYRACVFDTSGKLASSIAPPAVRANGTFHNVFTLPQGSTAVLGGISGANTKCQNAATKAKLGGTWKAILSSSTQDANSLSINGPVYITNKNTPSGRIVATDSSTFWNATHSTFINFDQFGTSASTSVYTATDSTGAYTGSACSDWTSTMGSTNIGYTYYKTGSQWIIQGTTALCNSYNSLYCIDCQKKKGTVS